MVDSNPEGDWSALLALVGQSIDLEASARASGVLRRKRQIRSGEDLFRLGMAYGPGGQSLSDVAAWAAFEGVAEMSKTAVLFRIRDSSDWFVRILEAMLASRAGAAPQGLVLGRKARLVDGSSITARGQGQSWRLHAVYDLAGQRFERLELTDKTQAEDLRRLTFSPGDLAIADRVYTRPEGLAQVRQAGADFLLRLGSRSLVLAHPDGRPFDLAQALAVSRDEGRFDGPVLVLHGRKKRWTPVPARVVILPKPPEAAKASRKKAQRASQRGGHRSDPLSLAAAEHLMLITSIRPQEADVQALTDAYRLRWQIELAFKRLKSLQHIDELPAKEPRLAKAWLATHLIAALLIEDLAPHLRDSPP